MLILIYNLFLIVKDFKPVKLNLVSLNNKFVFIILLLISIDLCYIFIFPLFIFNLLSYDKLLLFINSLDYFKSNNINFKPYYMFPNNNLDNGKEDLPSNINIKNNNQITTINSKTNITIGSGNVINVGKADLDNVTSKASTSKLESPNLLDNSDVDNVNLDNESDISKNKPNNVTNNYFTFNNLIIPEFKTRSLSKNIGYLEDLNNEYFKDLFTTEESIKKDALRKIKSVNNLNDFFLNIPKKTSFQPLNNSNSDILFEDNLPEDDKVPSIVVTNINNKSKTILNNSINNNLINKINNNLDSNIESFNNELIETINNFEQNNINNDLNNTFDIKIDNNKTGSGINCTFNSINDLNKYDDNIFKDIIKIAKQKHIELKKKITIN